MAANITEYLSKLQELAKQNIKLLKVVLVQSLNGH